VSIREAGQLSSLTVFKGGIVTFTPLAIAEDPVGCHSLMRNLAQHPLWECYLIPSIVGLSHALACGKNKPVSEIKRLV
jgi:hypothetical protein